MELTTRPTSEEIARAAGLRLVAEDEEGIRRVGRGRGFSYYTPSGDLITSREERERIAGLAIPPAWTDVWISTDAWGHIQATGRDAGGRKQYRYHPGWMERTSRHKYARMGHFGRLLPRIRRRVRRDLRREGMPRERVLAVVVRLLDLTGLRIGNDIYRRRNGTFGLTTLRRRHVAFTTTGASFRFRGKGGQDHDVEFADPGLAAVLQDCYELPGHEMFQYLDADGARHPISSDDVNAYIREVSQHDFTARDFRTWAGSVRALAELETLAEEPEEPGRRRQMKEVLAVVSEALRNTPSVCRDFYIHPFLVEGYLDGRLPGALEALDPTPVRGLRKAELRLLAVLQRLDEDGEA